MLRPRGAGNTSCRRGKREASGVYHDLRRLGRSEISRLPRLTPRGNGETDGTSLCETYHDPWQGMFASFYGKPDLCRYAGKAFQCMAPRVGRRTDAVDGRTKNE